MDALNRDLIKQVKNDLSQIKDFERISREKHISIGQQLEILHTPYHPRKRGWKNFIEVESGFGITVRFANRPRHVAKAMSEPGSEKEYEGKSLAFIERAYLSKQRKEAKAT